jgi:hypothetical protein
MGTRRVGKPRSFAGSMVNKNLDMGDSCIRSRVPGVRSQGFAQDRRPKTAHRRPKAQLVDNGDWISYRPSYVPGTGAIRPPPIERHRPLVGNGFWEVCKRPADCGQMTGKPDVMPRTGLSTMLSRSRLVGNDLRIGTILGGLRPSGK